MSDIGELVMRIKADASQLVQELRNTVAATQQSSDQMSAALAGVKSQFAGLLPALSLAALVAFGRSAIEAGAQMSEMSERTGMSVQMLSALDVVARQNGASIQDLANGIKFMNKNVSEAAADPNGGIALKFQQIGLSAKNLLALNTDQRFLAIAQAISEFGNAADRTNLRLGLLGRGAENLGNLMDKGADGIEKAMDQAKAMGLVLTDKQAADLKRINDETAVFVVWMERLAQVRLGEFINDFQSIVGWFSENNNAQSFNSLNEIEGHLAQLNTTADKLRENIKNSQDDTIGNWLGVNDRSVADLKSKLAETEKAISDFQQRARDITQGRETLGNIQAGGGKTLSAVPTAHTDPTVAAYIQNLKDSADSLGLSERALAIHKAEVQGDADALKDYNNGLRTTKTLTDDERASVDAYTGSLFDNREAQQKAIQAQKQMEEQLSSSLANMATDWKNAGQSITQTIQSIANAIIKSQITDPLVTSLFGDQKSGDPGIFGKLFSSISIPHFAAGGTPPMNSPSLVGENGPELFVPNSAGTIMPNGSFGGGQNVMVYQTINMSPGLPETVNAAIRNAAPGIAAMAHAGVMQAIQKGGPDAKIIGLRS